MKKILIITNEWSREDFGLIKAESIPEIKKDFFLIGNLVNVISAFEDIEVEVVYHDDLTPEMVNDIKPDRIITSGRMADWDLDVVEDEYKTELDLIRNYSIPLLGICGGMQLMAMAYDIPIGRMKGSDGTEVREFGVTEVTKLSEDSLFSGINSPMKFVMAHVDEIKDVPPGFKKIAQTQKCRFAAIKAEGRPIWGLQFHPEMYLDDYQDGKILLENFIYEDIF